MNPIIPEVEERMTVLALEIQAYCNDFFDGKLAAKEWLTLVVDAVQQHQAEAAPKPERYINFYGVPPCGHFLLFLPESQANERHSCYKCQKVVAMESEAEHLQHLQQAEQARQARIQALAAELADNPFFSNQRDGWEIDQEEVNA